MSKVIAFSNQKGGVGKTTSCVNLAAALALRGYKTLLIDFDPQSNATSALGLFDKHISASIYSALGDKLDIGECVRESDVQNLFFIPASNDLAGAEPELAAIQIGRELVLKERLDKIRKDFDIIFIDCPPSLGLLTVNALAASDGVVVPIQCEYFALEGLNQIMNTIRLVKKYVNENIDVLGVILTMYDGRSKLTKGVVEQIYKLFSNKVFDAKIPRNIRLAEAPSYGKPIVIYDKKCSGAVAYEALATEFINKLHI